MLRDRRNQCPLLMFYSAWTHCHAHSKTKLIQPAEREEGGQRNRSIPLNLWPKVEYAITTYSPLIRFSYVSTYLPGRPHFPLGDVVACSVKASLETKDAHWWGTCTSTRVLCSPRKQGKIGSISSLGRISGMNGEKRSREEFATSYLRIYLRLLSYLLLI